MNTFLSDILAQPPVLQHVLNNMLTEQRAELDEAARLIQRASRVVLTSMGSAYYSLLPMAYALSDLHPNVHIVETSELMRRPAFADTLYIIMSRSGESREIAALAPQLQAEGKPLLAITMTPESTLAKHATRAIHVQAPYDGFICTKAYSSMALVGLLIASQIAGQLTPVLETSLTRAFDWMQQTRQGFVEQMQGISWLGTSTTFLSRGVGLGLAQSGCLWLEEAARVRASYSSVDMFLHGPVEQVDEQFRGVWLDLQPDDTSARQYQEMRAKGGQWLTIVFENAYSGDIVLPDAGLPEAYRILQATIPIQLIAYQSSVQRGLEPGDMRYVGWVVK